MKTLLVSALLVVAFAAASAFLFPEKNNTKWDGLKVTWNMIPFLGFNSQPRTAWDAEKEGFKQVSLCNESSTYNGIAYVKDDDYILTLLYDRNGYIAGMQAGFTEGVFRMTGYPSSKLRPPFVKDRFSNGRYVVTVYFTDPSKICTKPRTQADFDNEGTGNGLWIQNGYTPKDFIKVPMDEGSVAHPWVQGKCFYTMGQHYWYNISEDMDCDTYFPVFLLYNKGRLNGLGWVFIGTHESPHVEHPFHLTKGLFLKKVPKCLASRSTTSMHIFLTDNARTSNRC